MWEPSPIFRSITTETEKSIDKIKNSKFKAFPDRKTIKLWWQYGHLGESPSRMWSGRPCWRAPPCTRTGRISSTCLDMRIILNVLPRNNFITWLTVGVMPPIAVHRSQYTAKRVWLRWQLQLKMIMMTKMTVTMGRIMLVTLKSLWEGGGVCESEKPAISYQW